MVLEEKTSNKPGALGKHGSGGEVPYNIATLAYMSRGQRREKFRPQVQRGKRS